MALKQHKLYAFELVVVQLTLLPAFQQIKHELSALSKKDHSQYDCCVVIMLSHGTEVRHVLNSQSLELCIIIIPAIVEWVSISPPSPYAQIQMACET